MLRTILAVVTILACSSLAAAQEIVLVSATGFARATSGNGSGLNEESSTNLAGFNLSVVKNFTGGHVDSSIEWDMTGNIMTGSFDGESTAQSQGQAGWAEAETTINFDAPDSVDMEYNGGFGGSGFGTVTIEVRNRVTNAIVLGGNGPNFVHVPAGQYKMKMAFYEPYGQVSGSFTLKFRPGNDDCDNARVVGNGSFEGSTFYAFGGTDGAATCGDSSTSKAVWFKHTPLVSGSLRITTCGSGYDTVLSVYDTNSCPNGTGTEVDCNDDAPAGTGCGVRQSVLVINGVANNIYFIRVSGFNGTSGSYTLNIGPVNDECEKATAVTAGTYPFDNTLANTDGPTLNLCTNNGQDNQVHGDLWYSFTAPADGMLNVDTCGSGFDTKLAIYQGSPCVGFSIYKACSDDNCSALQSSIENLAVTSGGYYTIRVGGYLANRGAGLLNITFTVPCAADFNGDGLVNSGDYLDYLLAFAGGDLSADLDGSGGIDSADYLEFLLIFAGGC